MCLISVYPDAVGWIQSPNELIRGLSEFCADKWYDLGVQLDVPVSELKAIYSNNFAFGVKRCLSETLTWWYNNTESPGGANWGDICASLHAINEKALAAKVAKKHGKHMYTCPNKTVDPI